MALQARGTPDVCGGATAAMAASSRDGRMRRTLVRGRSGGNDFATTSRRDDDDNDANEDDDPDDG